MSINYFSILKNAWKITWHNKYLLWFGFFLALAEVGNYLNYSFNEGEKLNEISRKMLDFLAQNTGWAIGAAIFLLLVFLVLAILAMISRGALIKSTARISKGEKTSFKEGFKEGKKYFWKIFSIGFVIGLFVLATLLVLLIPIVFLIYNKAYLIAVPLAALAALIIIPLVFLASFLKIYGYIYAVTGDISFWPAIENAYALLRKNIWPTIVMLLIFFLLNVFLAIAILFILLPLFIIFLTGGALLFLILKDLGIIIVGGIATLTLFVGILFFKSIYKVFSQATWLLFFQEIASPKTEEKVEEPATDIEQIKTPGMAEGIIK